MSNPLINPDTATRAQLIEWLCWNDPNGCYTDQAMQLEFDRVATDAELRACVREQLADSGPLARLRHHVTGAIERGEKQPIVEQRAAPIDPRDVAWHSVALSLVEALRELLAATDTGDWNYVIAAEGKARGVLAKAGL
jgi:hypothetical protein